MDAQEKIANAIEKVKSKKKDTLLDQWVDYKYFIRLWKHSIKKTLDNPPEVSDAMMKYSWMPESLKGVNMAKRWNIGRRGKALQMSYGVFDVSFQTSGGELHDLLTDPEHTVLYNIMIPNEILVAMHLKKFMLETPANTMAWYDQNCDHKYFDLLYSMGLQSDTCSYASLTPGVVMADEIPAEKCPAMVCSNRPCEAGAASWAVIEEKYKVPTYRLDVPEDFSGDPEVMDNFVDDMRGMIAFLTKHTGHEVDWELLRHVCENLNDITRLKMELWEMNRGPEPPACGDLTWQPNMIFVNIAPGTDIGVEVYEKLLRQAQEAHEDGEASVKNMQYRAILWNPPAFMYGNFWNWLERCWGIGVVMDMESFHEPVYIDTRTPDSMLRGLAEQWCFAPMSRHNRGPAENTLEGLNEMTRLYRPDFVLNLNHMGCRASVGLTGMLKEWSQDHTPICFANYDMYDNRIVSRQEIRNQINRFMQDVMHATPLDASLLNFDDSNDW